MIEYHNPEASVGIDNQPYGLSLSVTGTNAVNLGFCLLYTSPSPRDLSTSRMPSSA